MILSMRPSTAVTWPTSICPRAAPCRRRGRGQPQVLHVVLADEPGRGDGLGHVRPVVVREAHALGAAGGAGGVDEGGELVGADRGDPLLHRVGVLLQVRLAAALQFVEADDPALRVALGGCGVGRVDHHDVVEVRQVGAALAGLGELGGVLGDEDAALGVGEDERRLLGVRLRVDGGRGGARAHDGEVAEDPLHAGAGGEGHALLGPDAEVHEARRRGRRRGRRPGPS